MASAGTRAAALLFSAVVLFLLLQAPPRDLADLVASALDRFLGGRGGLLELATRWNMILLCNAILLVILRDAGVLSTPAAASSRHCSPPAAAAAACSVAPAPPHATTRSAVVVWSRRPRARAAAAHMHDAAAARRLAQYQPAAAATWAAPLLTTGLPPAQAAEEAVVATGQIVLAESPRNDDDDDDRRHHHDRDAVVEAVEHPTAIAVDGERECDDRRIVAVADDEKRMDDDAAREQQMTEMELEIMELADDRAFEEFIERQRRKMRQERLQLVRSRSGYQYQATATCY